MAKATSYGSLHYEAICFQQTSLLHGDPQGHYAALHIEQDEKKNKKRKRKILKKKRKTKRLPRAVDDSARGQRPRKRRPKACEYVIVLHNRGHEPIAVQLHVCGALGISLECLGKQPLPQAWCQGIPDSDVH